VENMVLKYLQRCGRELPAVAKVFRTEKQFREWAAEERKAGATAVWLADVGAKAFTTEAFAEKLRAARDGGIRHLALGIGPADGWSEAARSEADLRFSLSAMTMPHEVARLVLAEQIYRVATILQGHPYHTGH